MSRAQHRFVTELCELLKVATKNRDEMVEDADGTYTNWSELCDLIPKLQRRLKENDSIEDSHLAFAIGSLAERAHLRKALHAEVDRGLSLRDGGRKGARRRWPAKKAAAAEKKEWKAKYEEIAKTHPRWGRMQISDAVGKFFGRSGRTIRTHVPSGLGSRAGKKIGK